MADSEQAPSRFIEPPALVQEQAAPRDVNTDLLAEARAHIAQLTRNQPPFSRYLNHIEGEVYKFAAETKNHYTHGDFQHLAIMDPFKADIAIALRLSEGDVLKVAMPEVSINKNLEHPLYKKIHSYSFSQQNTYLHGTDPFSIDLKDQNSHLLIPTTSHALSAMYTINGMTSAQNSDYINRHESWHCREDVFDVDPQEAEDLANRLRNDPMSLIGDTDAYALMAAGQRAEAFADMGALGDMIRNGESPDIIDKVIGWRLSNPLDLTHRTEESLQALKTEIESMGVDKFKTLNNKELADMYIRLANDHGFTDDTIGNMIDYIKTPTEERPAYSEDHAEEREFKRGKALFESMNTPPPVNFPPQLSEEEKTQIQDWSPLKEMEDRAFKDHGKITPETMIKAYASVQTDMQNELRNHQDDKVLPEKMAQLQKTFVTCLSRIDYVQENKYYGVDITKTSPPSQPTAAKDEPPQPSTSAAKRPSVAAPQI